MWLLKQQDSVLNDILKEVFEDRGGQYCGPAVRFTQHETDHDVQLAIALPGVPKEAISLEFLKQHVLLEVNIDSKSDTQHEFTASHIKERFYINGVDHKKAEASLSEGVLRITMPKQEKEKPVSIAIK